MDRGSGDRGLSEVVGFMLVFGMLIISFTVYQGIVVPDQNRRVEFQHNQEVQGELQELRNAIVRTSATGSGEAVSVTLGATYPRRTIAQNLGVSAGTLQTSDPNVGLRISNVRASDDETRDYVSATIGPFESTSLQYTPVYSFYTSAPTTAYENTVAYNRFASTNLTLTDQVIVDGRRITLIAVDGNLTAARRGTVSISTEAISASSNRVVVSNTSGMRINITLPTALNASTWESILADEMGASGNVRDVTPVPGADAVNITLDGGVPYELRMAKVGVGDGAPAEPAAYVTDVEGNDATLATGGSQELEIEVRDRYNNPVSGVRVNVTDVTGGGAVAPSDFERSDADGRASFTYTAPGSAGPETVTLSIGDASSERQNVTFSLSVVGGAGGAGSGGGGAYGVSWQQPTGDQGLQSPCDVDDCNWDVEADSDDSLTLTADTDPPLAGIGVEFAVNDSSVAAIQTADAQTDSNGAATASLRAWSNGPVGVYVVSGGSSDVINLTVDGIDLVYNGDGQATGGSNSVVEFSLANNGPGPITITDVTVESSTAGDSIREFGSQQEVMIDANQDGDVDDAEDGTADSGSGFDVGDQITLDDSATIASGGSADITFYEFRDGPVFGSPEDMSDEEITVTIHYQDSGGNPSTRTMTILIS